MQTSVQASSNVSAASASICKRGGAGLQRLIEDRGRQSVESIGRRAAPTQIVEPTLAAARRRAASRGGGTAARFRDARAGSRRARPRRGPDRPRTRIVGIASRCSYSPSTAAADFAPQPARRDIRRRCRRRARANPGSTSARRRIRVHPVLVERRAAHPVEAHDARAAHALREILVGRADHDLLDARVRANRAAAVASASSASNSIIGQVDDAERAARLLASANCARAPGRCRRRSCSPDRGRCGTTRSRGRTRRDVRDAGLAEQREQRTREAAHGADLEAVGGLRRGAP